VARAEPKPDRRARTARGQRSREAIFTAAMGLFAEQGYEAASMVDIADRAALSKSVIYDHFASKGELHRALLEREADALLSNLAETLPGADEASAGARLKAGIEAFFAYAEERPVAWRLLVRDPPTDPELAATYNAIQQRASAAVALLIGGEHLKDRGQRRHKEMLAELLKSALTGLATWWSDHPDANREEVVEVAYAFAWFGLGRQAGEGV